MSQWDKLLLKIYRLSNDIRFDDIKKILEHYGYVMKTPGRGGSHRTFRKKGAIPLTIPESSPVKPAYVKQVRKALQSEDENEQQKP